MSTRIWNLSVRNAAITCRSLLNATLIPVAPVSIRRCAMSSEADASPVKSKSAPLSKHNAAAMSTQPESKTSKSTKTIVTSPNIYKPVGPYSQAILANNSFLYVSGVLGMDQQAQLVCGGAEAETRQIMENMKHVLEAGGASLDSVIKTTILLTNMNDFQAVNKVYSEYFTKDYPARATYEVRRLPKDASVEIEAVAISGDLVVAEAGPCPCSRD